MYPQLYSYFHYHHWIHCNFLVIFPQYVPEHSLLKFCLIINNSHNILLTPCFHSPFVMYAVLSVVYLFSFYCTLFKLSSYYYTPLTIAISSYTPTLESVLFLMYIPIMSNIYQYV